MDEVQYNGFADDLARLAVQRLLRCDVRWRSYDRASRIWQRTATIPGVLAAVAASMAAVSFVQHIGWLAVVLSIGVAVLVPFQNTIGASARVAENREAATRFEMLAADYERYAQLDLGPPMWRGLDTDLTPLRAHIDLLDE